MITETKVREYLWCNGDIDGYARSGRAEKNIVSDEEWAFIDEVVTKIRLIRNGLASQEFQKAHESDKACFDSEDTYKLLQTYEQKC